MPTTDADVDCEFLIFLPVRNGANYLQEAVESILGQLWVRWRLVLLENCSSDTTLEVANRYRGDRIEIIQSTRPLTIWENWNRILEYLELHDVNDVYCTMIGHDDYLHPSFLADIRGLIGRYPTASLYQTCFDMIDSAGQLIRPCRPIPELESGKHYLASRCWGIRDSYGTGFVFSASDYRAVGGIPDLPLLLFADDLLFYRLANLRFKVSTNKISCAYRLHRGSASSARSTSFYESQVEALEGYVGLLLEESLPDDERPLREAAVAALLAKDAMLYTNRLLLALVPARMRARIIRLRDTFFELSRGAPSRSWTFTNVLTRKVYDTKLILILCLVFGRLRLLAQIRRSPTI